MTLSGDHRSTVVGTIRTALMDIRPDITGNALERRVQTIFEDIVLLARCAKTACLITYADAIAMRGRGNPQNGQWLDEVYAYAIAPFEFPDLTMLVVSKATREPSPDAFEARRSILSKIAVEDIPAEQKRCFWFSGYEEILGTLEPIPADHYLVRILTPQPPREREIARAVSNAIGRIRQFGVEMRSIGKEYPGSLPRAELTALVTALWDSQKGRCALTGKAFELNGDEGAQDDRVSLDRIDNLLGYAHGNVQLVTQFANRARGTLPIEEARRRLVQFS